MQKKSESSWKQVAPFLPNNSNIVWPWGQCWANTNKLAPVWFVLKREMKSKYCNILILLPEASVSITMMLFMLYLWHRITFWRWSAAVSFCHEIAFWGLSTSLSFRILLQRLLLQDLEHATFSARKPSQTSVPIYIWWSFYFYGGKEQLWAIDSKTLSQKTKLLFPLEI